MLLFAQSVEKVTSKPQIIYSSSLNHRIRIGQGILDQSFMNILHCNRNASSSLYIILGAIMIVGISYALTHNSSLEPTNEFQMYFLYTCALTQNSG